MDAHSNSLIGLKLKYYLLKNELSAGYDFCVAHISRGCVAVRTRAAGWRRGGASASSLVVTRPGLRNAKPFPPEPELFLDGFAGTKGQEEVNFWGAAVLICYTNRAIYRNPVFVFFRPCLGIAQHT